MEKSINIRISDVMPKEIIKRRIAIIRNNRNENVSEVRKLHEFDYPRIKGGSLCRIHG